MSYRIDSLEGLTIELRPCPFCGGAPEWIVVPGEDYLMRCRNCHASTPGARCEPEAAAADWNAANIEDDHFSIIEDKKIDEYLAGNIKAVWLWDDEWCNSAVVVTEERILCVESEGEFLSYDEISGFNSEMYRKPLADGDTTPHFLKSEWMDGKLCSITFACGEKKKMIAARGTLVVEEVE